MEILPLLTAALDNGEAKKTGASKGKDESRL